MNAEQERLLRGWLDGRNPGDAPDRLRAAVAQVPYATRGSTFPALDAVMARILGPSAFAGRAAFLVILATLALALVGGALLLRSESLAPRGLIAYVAPLGSAGGTGISLVNADGTGGRRVTAVASNIFEHSPRWSADGRTLAFGRTSELSAFGACEGVGSIVLYDVATATERVVATGLRPMDVIEWAPSGDRIAFLWPPPGCGAPGELGFVDLATGTVTATELGDGLWRLQRAGATIEAVDTTVWEVDSLSGELVVRCEPIEGAFAGHVEVSDRETGTMIDLGIGWAPAWSPDESAMAFIQVTDEPASGFEHGASLAVAGVEGWQVRTLADIIDPDFVRFGDVARLPLVQWTGDGTAIYWLDSAGAHVVEVSSGRSLDLTRILIGASDLRWQPTPIR